MLTLRILSLAALCVGFSSCESSGTKGRSVSYRGQKISGVKTTAYTHTESDHLQYGAKSAVGSQLKYGRVRSAAADWSVYPMGTVFQIEGEPFLYEVDDYGSALVGTNTIDLYKPSKTEMNTYGAKKVNIRVIKWGSFMRSLAIMKPREKVSPAVGSMVKRIERSS